MGRVSKQKGRKLPPHSFASDASETFVEYLRRVGADQLESGREFTAEDYRNAADRIDALADALGHLLRYDFGHSQGAIKARAALRACGYRLSSDPEPKPKPPCATCGLPVATAAQVVEAHTSHMNGDGICWYGKGSAYSDSECSTKPANYKATR